MKRKSLLMTMVLVAVVMVVSTSAFAMNVGTPETHGLTGREFGAAVSGLAKSEPGAVAEHVGKKPEVPVVVASEVVASEVAPSEAAMAGGIPAVHGVSGKDFGAAVSGLAKTEPGAVAAHVRK